MDFRLIKKVNFSKQFKIRKKAAMHVSLTVLLVIYRNELPENSVKVTALFISNGITILVILICGLCFAKKKFKIFQCDSSQKHKDDQDTSINLVA